MEEFCLGSCFLAAARALVNGMVCQYTTGAYANKTRANWEPREHERTRWEIKKYEGIQDDIKNTKEYTAIQLNTKREHEGNAKEYVDMQRNTTE